MFQNIKLETFPVSNCYSKYGLVNPETELCIGGRLNSPIIAYYVISSEKGYKMIGQSGGEPYDFIGFKDTCRGDSGGPIWWIDENERAFLVATVSRGSHCAGKDRPGIATRFI